MTCEGGPEGELKNLYSPVSFDTSSKHSPIRLALLDAVCLRVKYTCSLSLVDIIIGASPSLLMFVSRCWSCCGTWPIAMTVPLIPWIMPSMHTSRSLTTHALRYVLYSLFTSGL